MHRQGRSRVLNPGFCSFRVNVDTEANRCEFRGDGESLEVAAIYV